MPIEDARVVVAAMRRSGRNDLPPPDLVAPLAVLTGALEEQAELTLPGRKAARDELVDALVRRAEADAEPSTARTDLAVVGVPYGAAGPLLAALGAAWEPSAPLDRGDDAVTWRHRLADPAWELRWHVPDYAEWLDERRGDLPPPPSTGRVAGGMAWCWARFDAPGPRLVVVDDGPEERRDAADRLVQETVAERARHSHRLRNEVTERYVRWRLERVTALLEELRERADLVVDGAEVRSDPSRVAAAVSALLDGGR